MKFFSLEMNDKLSARKTYTKAELQRAKEQTEWYTTVKKAEFEKWLNEK